MLRNNVIKGHFVSLLPQCQLLDLELIPLSYCYGIAVWQPFEACALEHISFYLTTRENMFTVIS